MLTTWREIIVVAKSQIHFKRAGKNMFAQKIRDSESWEKFYEEVRREGNRQVPVQVQLEQGVAQLIYNEVKAGGFAEANSANDLLNLLIVEYFANKYLATQGEIVNGDSVNEQRNGISGVSSVGTINSDQSPQTSQTPDDRPQHTPSSDDVSTEGLVGEVLSQ